MAKYEHPGFSSFATRQPQGGFKKAGAGIPPPQVRKATDSGHCIPGGFVSPLQGLELFWTDDPGRCSMTRAALG